jgi:hypothetical protein
MRGGQAGTHAPLSTAVGTVAPTGRPVAIRTIDVLTVEDGRIVAVCVVGDELGALLGLDALALRDRDPVPMASGGPSVVE